MTSSSEVISELKRNGWVLVRVHGSHHVFKHPDYPEIVVVPHPKKNLPVGTLRAIAKAAHLHFN